MNKYTNISHLFNINQLTLNILRLSFIGLTYLVLQYSKMIIKIQLISNTKVRQLPIHYSVSLVTYLHTVETGIRLHHLQ